MPRLSHHSHSGKYLHHRHTHFGSLLVLLFGAGAMLLSTTRVVLADQPLVRGELGLSGTVTSRALPKTPAVLEPKDGQHFDKTPILVQGLCQPITIVTIRRNQTLAGSTPCTDSGRFQLLISLVPCLNTLVARAQNTAGQLSPSSTPVNVYLDASAASCLSPLVVYTEALYQGVFADELLAISVGIKGGQSPYALQISWGDDDGQLYARARPGKFAPTHSYQSSGIYQINIEATDKGGRKATTTSTVIVSGAVIGATDSDNGLWQALLAWLWGVLVLVAMLAASFWLGERVKGYRNRHQPVFHLQ